METGMNELTVEALRTQFEDFESSTNDARARSEQARDYRDLKQWTPEQIEELNRRRQSPLVIPKIPAKVDFLVGLEKQQRADPRAFPRTQEHEQAADAVTDALRYVADNCDFNDVASEVFEQGLIVEGYAGAVIEPVMKRGQVEIEVNFIPFDRCYYDPYSRRRDFKDASYLGIVVWMDLTEAKRRYPRKAAEISDLQAQYSGNETFDDRPKWVDGKRKRIKVCQHYFIHEGVWHVAHFTDQLFLMDAKPSPLLDEHGEPECPIELVHGYITRENERYGLVQSMIGLQDEINHRRSKALHMLSTRQLWYEQGAVPNARQVVNELKKADGAVEFPAGTLENNRVQIETNTDLAAGQAQLLQEAKQEIDARGASNILQGMSDQDLSGRAIRSLQNNAQLEIGPLMDAHRHWKRRCYRQMWNRVKQFWDEERWVRVTDDEDNLKWVGLNQPVTIGQQLEQQAQEGDERAAQALQSMMAINDPRLNEVYRVENPVAEIDVDIIIDEAPDTLTVQQEQFEVMAELAKIYGPQNVPFELMLELSSLRNKDAIIEKLKGDPAQAQMMAQVQQMQQQMQQMMAQLELAQKQADIQKTQAEVEETAADIEQTRIETDQKRLENATVRAFPDVAPNINI